ISDLPFRFHQKANQQDACSNSTATIPGRLARRYRCLQKVARLMVSTCETPALGHRCALMVPTAAEFPGRRVSGPIYRLAEVCGRMCQVWCNSNPSYWME